MPNVETKPHASEASRTSESLAQWMVTLSPLLISLLLWAVIILVGQEMLRRLDTEISKEAKAFLSAK